MVCSTTDMRRKAGVLIVEDVVASPQISKAHSALPAEAPLDTAIVAGHAGNVLADALVERWLPRHELEADTVVNHGEPARGEISGSDQPASDMLSSLSPLKAQPALGRHQMPDAGDFGLLEPLQQVL